MPDEQIDVYRVSWCQVHHFAASKSTQKNPPCVYMATKRHFWLQDSKEIITSTVAGAAAAECVHLAFGCDDVFVHKH